MAHRLRPEAAMRSPYRLYLIVTLTGAVVMALEIISSRILAPHFGNSVYVWGSIISVFLAALSIGYFWGGRLADRRPQIGVLGTLIIAAALCEMVLLLAGTRLAGLFGAWLGSTPGGTLLTATALFGLPSVFLATVSPFAIRLAAREIAGLGDTAGKLFALSTGGSLFGTLASTFLLIPSLELRRILALLVVATATAAALTFRRGSASGLLRLGSAATLAVLAVAMVATPSRVGGDVLHTRMSPYQTLEVSEVAGVRYLRSDRVLQSAIGVEDRLPALHYLRHAPGALLVTPEIDRMLVLGMGGGAVGSYLRGQIRDLEVDYAEIDAAVPEIARDYLFFEADERTRVHVADGRLFLVRNDERWDFIYCDTYIGLSVPFHLTTVEFFDLVRERLAPGGVFGVNLASGLSDPFVQAFLRTAQSRFPTVYVFQVGGSSNLLVLASRSEDTIGETEMLRRAEELDRRFDFSPDLAEIASRRLEVSVDPATTLLLTDDYAPANHLIRLGRKRLELPGRPLQR